MISNQPASFCQSILSIPRLFFSAEITKNLKENIFYCLFLSPSVDHESSLKIDTNDNHHDVGGIDIDNDDDMPVMGDIDSTDHDSNDMSRPRKIRR